MFKATRPSSHEIERFLAASRDLALSYDDIGMAQREPAGYDIDETIVVIGKGRTDFDRAKAALAAWEHFDLGWVELFPPASSIEPGSVVGVLIRHLGFWSLNGCRVLYGLGNRSLALRFGFGYGTLVNHAERGEELFEVALREDRGDVVYRIRAASRPRAVLARLGYPIARVLQSRFRRDSAEAMRRAVARRQG